jgi:predicted RNA-binding Zn-ribbon protein involved in translation (DUF1610 family)
MQDDDFFDFMIFNELMFPENPDETFECQFCGRVIEGDEKVMVSKDKKTFKCPGCGQLINTDY